MTWHIKIRSLNNSEERSVREAVSPRLGAFLLSGIAPLFGRSSGGGGAGERAGPLQLAPASFAPNGCVVLGL